MKELRRRAYLQAMGIQPCYPRRVLPGAGPSPVYDLTDAAAVHPGPEVEAVPETTTAEARGDSDGRSVRHGGTQQPDDPPSSRMADESEPSSRMTDESETNGEPAPGLRFSLRFYALGAKLAVLSEVPHDVSQHDRDEATRLLAAILRALELPSTELASASELLNWPLTPDQPAAETGADHARRALAGFLTRTRERHGYANLLVLSSRLQELLPGAGGSEGFGDYQPKGREFRITSSHSLAAMLAVPQLKREVWEHLQPLRQRLRHTD